MNESKPQEQNERKNVCVFCSAASAVAPNYHGAAYELGVLIGKNNFDLTYGGTSNGLMGDVKNGVQKEGGRVLGILAPAFAQFAGGEDTCIFASNLSERKSLMALNTNVGFIGLPGGFGTLDEIFTVIADHQAQKFSNPDILIRPIILLNTNGFYDPLLVHLDRLYEEGFARSSDRDLYTTVSTPRKALMKIQEYATEAEMKPDQVMPAYLGTLLVHTRHRAPASL